MSELGTLQQSHGKAKALVTELQSSQWQPLLVQQKLTGVYLALSNLVYC